MRASLSPPHRLRTKLKPPPRALPSCPSAATSSRATPRPPTRSQAFLARALEASGATATDRRRRWCRGSATRCCRTTRSKPTAATSWTSSATCRPRASTPLEVTADHVKLYKRALLEAGMTLGHRRPAAVGAARRLRAARGQGAGLLGDRPGHRRRQGPRRPEERHALADPAAGDRPAGGHPHRHACRACATWR